MSERRESRYDVMFRANHKQGVFIPFLMMGDPNLDVCVELVDVLVEAGADALELGIPFSDPIADGPVIQAAATRALGRGVTPGAALEAIAVIRERHPTLPIGLLVYANLVYHDGVELFYKRSASAGVDSILVADVPAQEAAVFADVARRHGIDQVLIATPNADDDKLDQIANLGSGYTYTVTRVGVTGARETLDSGQGGLIERLAKRDAPPSILGFGISKPAHVQAAMRAGAAGVVVGSAIVSLIEQRSDDKAAMFDAVAEFVSVMKGAATNF